MNKKTVMTMLGAIFIISSVYAQDSTTCSGLLLKNQINVRAAGMGNAQAAVLGEGSAAYDYNPAALLDIKHPRVAATYYSGLAEDAFGSISYDMRLRDGWNMMSHFLYYDAGVMELVTYDGDISNINAQRDMLLSLGAAKRFGIMGQVVAFGVSAKMLYSTLVEEYSAFALAGDLGVYYEIKPLAENLNVGLALKNIGTPIQYDTTADPLPAYGLAGLSYAFDPDPVVNIRFAGDVQYDLEEKWNGNVGLEVFIADMVAVRGGYKLGVDMGGITAGLGVVWQNFSLNYALSFVEVLNSAHRVSLGYVLAPIKSTGKSDKPAEPEKSQADLLEEMVADMQVTAKPEKDATRVQAQVLEVRRKGGLVNQIVLNIGRNHGIKKGYSGSLLDAKGAPIAGIIIEMVDPNISLAEVQGLSMDIDDKVWAIVETPGKGKEE